MKILTKEEEQAHYNATVRGGAIGGTIGLIVGTAGTFYAAKRLPTFTALTPQFRAFLVASTSTFATIIAADRASRRYETEHNAQRLALSQHHTEYAEYEKTKPLATRARDWAADNRYSIVFTSWLASMGIALAIVRRNPFLSTGQKLVQSRVYAQGLTLAVLLASFGIEANDATKGKGRWETIKVLDPADPAHKRLIEKRIHHERYEGEDQWMEVIAAEEQREKERKRTHEKELKNIKEAQAKAHEKVTHKQ